MAGMEFEYDEEGSTFYYFLLSFWALLIIPGTYYLWPTAESKDEKERNRLLCHCAPCEGKRQKLKVKTSWLKTRRKAVQISLIFGWVIFVLLAYKVSTIQIEHQEYDPFQILQIDRGASMREIKKAYRKLSLEFHPDKYKGDEKMFMRVAKAYAALTDEESRKNWEEHGNPDGPGVTTFGIALPKWIVDDKNSMWVLLVYIVLFMVIMPACVGVWWYRSIKFSKDQVLLNTTRLYLYFFSKNPQMILKKVIMVLGASFEFDKANNSEIMERPSDNEEIPILMKQLPNLDEKNKERPLCFGYSVKARALLHAHFARMELPPQTLKIDQMYVLKKCPALINEMINILSQLVASAMARQRMNEMPRLETVENCMKVSQMMTQALEAKSNPLQQLPHIRPDMLRHFVTRKRNVQRIRDLVAMDDDERRALLRSLTDDEYQDVINVCATLPNVVMVVKSEVLDDDDRTIRAGSIVTVTVSLRRKNMMDDFDINKLTGERDEPAVGEEEQVEEQDGDEENKGVEEAASAENKPKAWQKPAHGKGKKKAKPKKAKQAFNWKKPAVQNVGAKPDGQVTSEKPEGEEEAEADDDVERNSDSESEAEEIVGEGTVPETKPQPDKKKIKRKRADTEHEDDDWEKFQEEAKKENSLETKKKESHPVHCPHFPDEKQEGWWLYVADRKNHMLVTAPVQILSLKKEEEMTLKFSAPPKVGVYTYSVVLRSDSYFDFDQHHNFKLDVKEAKVIEDHPQWDISDSEDEADAHKNDASNDSDYSTDMEDDDDDDDYDD
ncbi:SEC63-like protein [Mya arenaria]|uniref:SEC63-like protein n=1 Tax=Mya arenaria TaxID=6604 RepID=A0ABY7EGT9_MYAAR|nr:translocation protein SEC63 homolog [Mya arenaria]WAR09208.1 SEC63-like protein [Mya arenaria]